MKKIILTISLLLVLSPFAWSVTRHTDYGTTMEIKSCNDCHLVNNVEPNHGSFWVRDHRKFKEKLPSNCNDCHQHSFCLDCHTGGGIDRELHVSNSGVDYMPRSHRTDFREIHPIKALDDPRSCVRCHDSKKFCNECHEKFSRNDLRVISHRRGWSDLDLKLGGPKHSLFNASQCQTCHPNSILPKHQWSAEHSREARKNLTSCQTCHPDGDVCMKCHSALTGLRISPHPRNWGKISGRLKDAGNNKTCTKCH
ncbi:MAG: cytochrome C [Nitrospirae bacterium]|nr:cytochrome C [Nitrospirota bacterium]